MTGKFMAYVLSVFTFFYMVLIGISFFMYMTVSERVNDICYDAAETVSTRGILSEEAQWQASRPQTAWLPLQQPSRPLWRPRYIRG